jgi:hypothetical protein
MYDDIDSFKKGNNGIYRREHAVNMGEGAASLLYHRASAAPSLLQVTVYQVV